MGDGSALSLFGLGTGRSQPCLLGNIALIGNVVDVSMLVSPSLSLSVSDEVQLVAGGGFVGVGDRPKTTSVTEILINPDALQVGSEFGMIPGSDLSNYEVTFEPH